MTRIRAGRLAALAAAGAAGIACASPAQAGLLEFLFGGGPSYAPAPVYSPAPLDVRVNPRRARKPGSAKARENKIARVTPIDPVKNPQWYLEDPTLRRGDIIVLKGRVVVFEGERHNVTPQDFTALSQSRLVSKSERNRISKMVDTRPADGDAGNRAEAAPTIPAPQTAAVESPPGEVKLATP